MAPLCATQKRLVMTLRERIDVLVELGERLHTRKEELQPIIQKTYFENRWFTETNCEKALDGIATHFLRKDKLQEWTSDYHFPPVINQISVGLILAGNIPMVGFHDVLAVFISGNKSIIKLSDKDKHLIPLMIKWMGDIDSKTKDYFSFVDRLSSYDAVIATGSNNTATHFEYYFKHVPSIIRKNRNAVAILDGKESKDTLLELGRDVFDYFGLGCRNVSKIYVPKDYDFNFLMEVFHEYNELVLHNKYKNNFDYNYAIFLLNQDPFLANGCIIVKETKDIATRIAMLGYEYYENLPILVEELTSRKDEIQCIVSQNDVEGLQIIPPGKAQQPHLSDYADGIDTLSFLLELK